MNTLSTPRIIEQNPAPTYEQTQQWVNEMAEVHFVESRGVFTCHTTLEIDIQEFGITEQAARAKLCDRIHASNFLSKALLNSRSFRLMFPLEGIVKR